MSPHVFPLRTVDWIHWSLVEVTYIFNLNVNKKKLSRTELQCEVSFTLIGEDGCVWEKHWLWRRFQYRNNLRRWPLTQAAARLIFFLQIKCRLGMSVILMHIFPEDLQEMWPKKHHSDWTSSTRFHEQPARQVWCLQGAAAQPWLGCIQQQNIVLFEPGRPMDILWTQDLFFLLSAPVDHFTLPWLLVWPTHHEDFS